MSTLKAGVASLSLLAAMVAATPALASSTAGSSVSDSISTSVGSFSDSIGKSSESSKGDKKDVADGNYRVVDVAAAEERPGIVRVKLQAVAADAKDGEFFLYVPKKAFDAGRLAQGETVTATGRPYGVEFARADNREAFFLVMADTWHRELASNPVVL